MKVHHGQTPAEPLAAVRIVPCGRRERQTHVHGWERPLRWDQTSSQQQGGNRSFSSLYRGPWGRHSDGDSEPPASLCLPGQPPSADTPLQQARAHAHQPARPSANIPIVAGSLAPTSLASESSTPDSARSFTGPVVRPSAPHQPRAAPSSALPPPRPARAGPAARLSPAPPIMIFGQLVPRPPPFLHSPSQPTPSASLGPLQVLLVRVQADSLRASIHPRTARAPRHGARLGPAKLETRGPAYATHGPSRQEPRRIGPWAHPR